jgi:hypothetical protein
MSTLDPRFAAIVAAAGAAAAALNPTGSAVVGTIGALLQAATDLHANYTAGNFTDEDMATEIARADINLAGLRADIENQGSLLP